ncbi:MAG: hypothetical protein A2Y91_02180 [Chloroflexi bacterium RBG_13_54_8]|nr:MAG: hypothetical protein A2Y91_02180 [Chloroflexi bacterium RBG_13_54_8]
MIELSDSQKAEFAHRSYHAVDGLWFMKVEERYGFDAALEIDNEVWQVLPKIQARMLKAMAKVQEGMEALLKCLTIKLALEGFQFDAQRSESGTGFTVSISRCPWHDAMLKSGREELSGKVNSVVCCTEHSVWAAVFGHDIHFEQKDRICTGSDTCLFKFHV